MSDTTALNRRAFLRDSFGGGSALGGLLGLGLDLRAAQHEASRFKFANTREVPSVCPYCAVGCGQLVSVLDGKIVNIEGNPDSPVNEGRLCPKGATAMQLATSARRVDNPLYRAPGSDHWQQITWDDMLNKLAQRIKDARDASFVGQDASGNTVNRTEGIAFAGGAAFSSEEGYFAAKVMRGLGLVYLEQQARV